MRDSLTIILISVTRHADFNGTQVPPEWHAWLNAIRKDPPHLDPVMQRSAQKWQTVSFENLTGSLEFAFPCALPCSFGHQGSYSV